MSHQRWQIVNNQIVTRGGFFFSRSLYLYLECFGERGGSVVECRTPEREVGGSIPTAAVLCPWARHFTPRKNWLITQEAVAPSRHDWKIVDWDIKPQHTNSIEPIWGISELEIYVKIVISWWLGVNCSYAYNFCWLSALVFQTVISINYMNFFDNFSMARSALVFCHLFNEIWWPIRWCFIHPKPCLNQFTSYWKIDTLNKHVMCNCQWNILRYWPTRNIHHFIC